MANDGTVKLGVEFDSDDVKKEFEGLKSEAREVERSLKEVNKALKLDPGNTELIAIIMTELFTRPDHASPKSRICVTSRIIGIAMAARSIFTLLLRIRTTNITKVKRTIPI